MPSDWPITFGVAHLKTTIFLCRCGGSGTKPFCDGTHETLDFEAANRAPETPVPIAVAS